MKCPHCLQAIHVTWKEDQITYDKFTRWECRCTICPACFKSIIELRPIRDAGPAGWVGEEWRLVEPKGISRGPIPVEVDDLTIVSDYKEACLVLSDSAKASAALSRRCLQYILREKANVEHSDLSNEIQQLINSGTLPSDLSSNLDYIRSIGNFAAHPIKSKSSGEVVDVEPGEAEWNLDVIEELMDYYFVRPARNKKRKEDLNIKLKDAGKPEIPA